MTAEEKKKIDIKKCSTFMHNGLITTGILLITATFIMFFLEVNHLYQLLVTAIIIVIGLLYTLINANKKNEEA